MDISNLFYRFIIRIPIGINWAYEKIYGYFLKKSMAECGKNVTIKPRTSLLKGVEHFHISDDVNIGKYAVIFSTEAELYIGRKVITAPYLKIITGNHRIDCVGHFMFDADYEKHPEDDQDVVIEGDNWIGINVTILSGVTIGRGCVIAAGAVVNKSTPPYTIMGGCPAHIIRYRFTIEEILEHERNLYAEKDRLNENYLRSLRT